MKPSLPYLLSGYVTLSVDAPFAADLLEICRRYVLPYENFQNLPEGGISLRFRASTARRVRTLCEEYGIPLCERERGGFPLLFRRLFTRPGLIVGFLLGAILLLLAQSVVWDVRISGNQTLSDREIEESLAACGFGVGTALRGFRADVTENHILLSDRRLAWISINRRGTVAYVEVREAVNRLPADEKSPCDVVAAVDGVIDRVELDAGNVLVSAGQTVKKGEILVSGLYDSEVEGIRYTAARARVYARTTRVFSVTIPLSYEQKVYQTSADGTSGRPDSEKTLIFFGNPIKFSKKTGNVGALCDTIENEESWGLPLGVGFPISLSTVWYLPYTVQEVTRTYAEAEELAYYELSKYIAALQGGAELLGKTVTVHHGEEALTLTASLSCMEDIAASRRIEIEQ